VTYLVIPLRARALPSLLVPTQTGRWARLEEAFVFIRAEEPSSRV
jgi:hypothetical protein